MQLDGKEVEPLSSLNRSRLIEAGRALGLEEDNLSSWYSVDPKDVVRILGRNEINSQIKIHMVLSRAFPEHVWERGRFVKFPLGKERGKSLAEWRKELLEIGHHLGIKENELDKWYTASNKDIRTFGGTPLLKRFENSKWKMLLSLFPDHRWDFSRFSKKPDRYWESEETQRNVLLSVGMKLGIDIGDYESWYKVKSRDFMAYGGSGLILRYNSSVSKMVTTLLSEHTWNLEKFAKKPQNFWESEATQRAALLDIGHKLGIMENEWDKWYEVSSNDIIGNGGEVLLTKKYSGSVASMLMNVFPEHKWNESKFQTKPRSFWQSTDNQREFLKDLAHKLGFEEGDYEAWYQVNREDFIKNGASALLELYNGSPRAILTRVFSEFEWHPWRFRGFRSQWFWRDPESVRYVKNYIASKLNLKADSDWTRVTKKELRELGLEGILRKGSDLQRLLKEYDK